MKRDVKAALRPFLFLALLATTVDAFACKPLSAFTQSRKPRCNAISRGTKMEYIPDGLTKEQWKKMKQKEQDKNKNMKFNGTSGMKFRSRSFADFQKGRESGLYKYNMPLEGDVKKLLREKKIKPEDVPYIQRPGGMPDNSDLKKGIFKGMKMPWEKEKPNGNGW